VRPQCPLELLRKFSGSILDFTKEPEPARNMDEEKLTAKSSPFNRVLHDALAHALNHLDNLEHMSVDATVSVSDLRHRFSHPLNDSEIDAAEVINELVAAADGGVLGTAGGRFFGWVNGGSFPVALAADWLTSTWNQCAAIFAAGPAVAVMEEVSGIWLKDLLQLPLDASFALVTGCQMAHVTCLAAARCSLYTQYGWSVEDDGLQGAPNIHVLTSNEHHGSITRAVRLLGLGTRHIVRLPVDEQGRLSPSTLSQALNQYAGTPTIVVLQAGDINTGTYDSFADLIPLARNANAWVHIDGAFGLWAAASPRYRHLLAGGGQADSWVTDGHKWLNVPFDCGYAFVARPDAHLKSMSYKAASYLTYEENARDSIDWTPDWSRRARGVATYATLRQLGRQGVCKLIERCCGHAQTLVTSIGALPGAELISKPTINQGLVRFLDERSDGIAANHNRFTDAIIKAINRSGEAFFTGTDWRKMRCMRVSVSNWQTNDGDVTRAVAAVKRALEDALPTLYRR
jgi:glutamate/tyrosine decarboxylase-like PLP-dependent enzyme